MYRSLNAGLIIETCQSTRQHIDEQFAGSGLSKVAAELLGVSRSASELASWLARPHWPLRGLATLGIVAIVTLVVEVARLMKPQPASNSIAEWLQGLDAALNEVVFISIAAYFLVTLENRIKRHRALRSLHELRSIAHIIDMHQLTKDPERPIDVSGGDSGLPRKPRDNAELIRYLNDCSDLLALISKLAALHVQYFHDPITISAVNEVENLTNGLSRKIWQKIMIFDRILAPSTGAGAPALPVPAPAG